MDDNNSSSKEREQPEGQPDPYAPEATRIVGGEVLIWRPSRTMRERIPCVTLGRFKSGRPAINFRLYKMVAPGVIEGTYDGIALSFSEFAIVMERLQRITEGAPDAAA